MASPSTAFATNVDLGQGAIHGGVGSGWLDSGCLGAQGWVIEKQRDPSSGREDDGRAEHLLLAADCHLV